MLRCEFFTDRYKLHSASALLFSASLIFEILLSRNVDDIKLIDDVGVSTLIPVSSPVPVDSTGRKPFLSRFKSMTFLQRSSDIKPVIEVEDSEQDAK